MTAMTVRSDLIEFIQKDLIGPAKGVAEELDDPPKIRYVAGVLFPQECERNESASVSGIEADDEGKNVDPPDDDDALSGNDGLPTRVEGARGSESAAEDDDYDQTITLANTYRPSAMGLSFLVEGSVRELRVQARAAIYETHLIEIEGSEHASRVWRRVPLQIAPSPIPLLQRSAHADEELSPGLKLRAVIRAFRDGRKLVTISLYNTTMQKRKNARVFFQVGFSVVAEDGSHAFPEYATIEGALDDEETALAMLYSSRRAFAVGHGCAANWTPTSGTHTDRLETDVVPAIVVPPIVPYGYEAPGLSMEYLSGRLPDANISAALEDLCGRYEEWILDRERDATEIEPRFRDAASEHLKLCRCALDRMRSGVRLLATDSLAMQAFILTNRVMLMQQHHSRLRRTWSDPWSPLPSRDDYRSDWSARKGYWRAFQIAFVLMTLPGLVPGEVRVDLPHESVSSRDLVDLIWFPTGGGKTEAYLAVTAFSIFTARLYDRERSGCLVLMRYTLRLLTSQQFQRAASLICACELIRRSDPQLFGDHPVSIGLWVGVSLTPNTEPEAVRQLTKLKEDREAKNPFQLLTCPWCGTKLDDPQHLGYADRGGRQIFACPARDCPFSKRESPLPVCVVDESIYANPPTLLIGTVDKFALLAWREKARHLFEVGGGPEVIIQDELHLIAGPLGSMVGLYESVIDYLCSRRGRRPKIIASTATIRRAREQCTALYDRPMFQFPPPGLDASDSYFAVEDAESPGREYMGILPTASSSPLTAQIRTVVALQQGALLVAPPGDDEALDPYWTLIQYFGSIKELGRAATFLTADIPEFLPTMYRRWGVTGAMRRFMRNAEELTSRKDEDEIPKILARLENKYRGGARGSEQALDTVLATNMISVGVDVERLGLMLIVTQPKGTSEYIQASSRVGRKHPGAVVTLYNAGRPRDRSHYEHFRGYHGAFYRHVEPTSVTPFSPPAMLRALHALLVIAGRHIAKWEKPTDLDESNPAFSEFLEYLRARVGRIDADHLPEFDALIRKRLDEWMDNRPKRWGDLGGAREERVLMRAAGTDRSEDDPDSWETPTSMRNVDVECRARVISRYPTVIRGGH